MTTAASSDKNNNKLNEISIKNSTIGKGKKLPHNILLVDDDDDTLLSIKMYFKDKTEFKIDTFSSPLQALSAFKAEFYDLCIIDVLMPEMHGFEFYQQIIKKSKNVNIKACFITAHETYYDKLKKEFPELDVGCFISKPIELSKLAEKIKEELQSPL